MITNGFREILDKPRIRIKEELVKFWKVGVTSGQFHLILDESVTVHCLSCRIWLGSVLTDAVNNVDDVRTSSTAYARR